jgi:hypothetical protein
MPVPPPPPPWQWVVGVAEVNSQILENAFCYAFISEKKKIYIPAKTTFLM